MLGGGGGFLEKGRVEPWAGADPGEWSPENFTLLTGPFGTTTHHARCRINLPRFSVDVSDKSG